MALEATTLDRMLLMTKQLPKKKKDGGRRKTVQIYKHFKLLLAFIATIMVKHTVGGKLP